MRLAAFLGHIEHRIFSVFTGLLQWGLPGIYAHSDGALFSIPMRDIGGGKRGVGRREERESRRGRERGKRGEMRGRKGGEEGKEMEREGGEGEEGREREA